MFRNVKNRRAKKRKERWTLLRIPFKLISLNILIYYDNLWDTFDFATYGRTKDLFKRYLRTLKRQHRQQHRQQLRSLLARAHPVPQPLLYDRHKAFRGQSGTHFSVDPNRSNVRWFQHGTHVHGRYSVEEALRVLCSRSFMPSCIDPILSLGLRSWCDRMARHSGDSPLFIQARWKEVTLQWKWVRRTEMHCVALCCIVWWCIVMHCVILGGSVFFTVQSWWK